MKLTANSVSKYFWASDLTAGAAALPATGVSGTGPGGGTAGAGSRKSMPCIKEGTPALEVGAGATGTGAAGGAQFVSYSAKNSLTAAALFRRHPSQHHFFKLSRDERRPPWSMFCGSSGASQVVPPHHPSVRWPCPWFSCCSPVQHQTARGRRPTGGTGETL